MTGTDFHIPIPFWLRSSLINLRHVSAFVGVNTNIYDINADHDGSEGKNRSNAPCGKRREAFLNFNHLTTWRETNYTHYTASSSPAHLWGRVPDQQQ